MTAQKSRGFLALENYLAADYFWAYIIQIAAWTYAMFQTIDAPFTSVQWVVAYVRETNGAAQLFVLTTIIGVNIWRIAVKFWQERIKSIKEQVEEGEARGEARGRAVGEARGEARGRDAVITALRKGGMSRDEINDVVIRSGDDELITDVIFGGDSEAYQEVIREARREAVNRIIADMESAKRDRETEKPESEL